MVSSRAWSLRSGHTGAWGQPTAAGIKDRQTVMMWNLRCRARQPMNFAVCICSQRLCALYSDQVRASEGAAMWYCRSEQRWQGYAASQGLHPPYRQHQSWLQMCDEPAGKC